MKKIVFALFISFVSISISYAQIAPVVEVNREYEIKLTDARKPFVSSELPESLQDFNIGFDYSIFNRPVGDLYDFTPRQVAALEKVPTEKLPHFSAIVGVQYPLVPKVDLYFQHAKENFDFGLYGHHNSFFHTFDKGLESQLTTARRGYKAGAYMKFIWDVGEFKTNISFSNSSVDEKGFVPTEQFAGYSNNLLDVQLSLNSANPDPESFFYDANLSYRNSSGKYSSGYSTFNNSTHLYRENVLKVDARVGSSFDAHRIYLDVITNNCWYGQDLSIGVVEFTPIYQYQKGAVNAKMGINFSSLYGLHEGTKIHPFIDAKVELIEKGLWLRASVFGGNKIESFSDYAETTPWLIMSYTAGDKIRFTDTKVDAKFTVETRPFKYLSLNVFGSYAIYENKLKLFPEFLNASDAEFVPSYSTSLILLPKYLDYAQLSAGLEAVFSSKSFSLMGSLKYNKYTPIGESSIDLLPKIEAFVEANYSLYNKLFISANFTYKSKVTCYDDTLPEYKDLGVRVQYNLSPNFAVFAKAGNLLGAVNYIHPYIPGIPRNFGGGICIDF